MVAVGGGVSVATIGVAVGIGGSVGNGVSVGGGASVGATSVVVGNGVSVGNGEAVGVIVAVNSGRAVLVGVAVTRAEPIGLNEHPINANANRTIRPPTSRARYLIQELSSRIAVQPKPA
jgi:hypothetical protein